MVEAVKRRYDNSRREAQVRASRRRVIEVAKTLFTQHGYPATTIEVIAEGSDVPVATLYRLFGTKRALLKAVLDTSFVGDDEPVAFGDRPQVRAALSSADPKTLIDTFAGVCRKLMDRTCAIHHVLATAAVVDDEAADLLAEVRRQAHTGRSRIVTALRRMDALDPVLTRREAEDIVYTCLSFEVAHILTVEQGWSGAQYEVWISRSLRTLLPSDPPQRDRSSTKRPTKEA